jgi:molybdopterin/thiamine biosynthesis adenylyltransferase
MGLRRVKVAVLGLGLLGSFTAITLVREGFSQLKILDRDIVVEENITRQLYTPDDLGLPKAEALSRTIMRIAPNCIVEPIVADVTTAGLEAVDECDVVVSCFDNAEARLAASRLACRAGIPLVDLGCEEDRGQVLVTVWGRTACIFCLGISHGEAYCPTRGSPPLASILAGIAVEAVEELVRGSLSFSLAAVRLHPPKLETLTLNRREGCPEIHWPNLENAPKL